MKIRSVVFVVLLLINAIFVMIPAAKEIQEYKEALLPKDNAPTFNSAEPGRFVYNDRSYVSMLKELESMFAAHGLTVEKRSLSSELLQDKSKIILELSLAGKKEDIQNLLMEEAFQSKRYRITYLMLEQRSSKVGEKNITEPASLKSTQSTLAAPASSEPDASARSTPWLTQITIHTYFKE